MSSINGDEEQSLFSNNQVSVGSHEYSKTNDDPFSFRAHQISSKKRVRRGEHSPAYSVFIENNLLFSAFRKERFSDIFLEEDLVPNSSFSQNFAKKWRWGVYWTPGCGLVIYNLFNKEIVVPPGHISCYTDEDNNYIFAKPGVHNIQDPFLKQVSNPIPINGSQNQRNVIEHGNRTVLTVPQGMLGIVTDMGQLILLPPGLHSWKSETIRFDKMVKLDDAPVLQIGPYTIVTVDEGYVAITMNNGKQVLLEGGTTHLLTHQKWKFEQFMNMTLQSEDLAQFKVTTSDKLILSLDATITWRVTAAEKAALMLSDSSTSNDISIDTDIQELDDEEFASSSKLRNQVMAHAMSGLASFIGSVQYSGYFHPDQIDASSKGSKAEGDETMKDDIDINFFNTIFDEESAHNLVENANMKIEDFGVEILNVSLVSVNVCEENYKSTFALAALSSAEALQLQAKAKEAAKATKIEAEAKAIARKIQAEAEAESAIITATAEAEATIKKSQGQKSAELIRAEGLNQVAKILESSKFASSLETIRASASAIKDSDKFFFGKEPHYFSNLVKDNV